jgi:hypothetical protein
MLIKIQDVFGCAPASVPVSLGQFVAMNWLYLAYAGDSQSITVVYGGRKALQLPLGNSAIGEGLKDHLVSYICNWYNRLLLLANLQIRLFM